MSSHEVELEKLPNAEGYGIVINEETVGYVVFLQHRKKPFLSIAPRFFDAIKISEDVVTQPPLPEVQAPTEKQIAYALYLAKRAKQELSEGELKKMTRKAVSELIDKLREAGKKEAE